MRKLSLTVLAVGIFALASGEGEAQAAKSAKGNELVWVTGFPKCTNLGTEPPTVAVQFSANPAAGWTVMQLEFSIRRFQNSDGTGYNGKSDYIKTNNFSIEYDQNVPLAGNYAQVTDNFLRLQKPGDTDSVQEVNSGYIQIR